MISRGLLDVAKQLSSTHGRSKASTRAPKKSIVEFTEDFRESVTKKGITYLQATEAEIKNRIRSYSKMKDGILESNKGIARHIQMMKKMQLSNEKTLGIIKQNIKLMNTRLDSMLQEKRKFRDVEAQLKVATDFASAGVAMDEAGKILHGVEKTVSEIKQLLQENDKRRDDMRQDALKMKINLENALKVIKRMIEEEEQQEPEQEQEEEEQQEPEQEQEGGEQEEERASVVNITDTDTFPSSALFVEETQKRTVFTPGVLSGPDSHSDGRKGGLIFFCGVF
ncbi:putative autophagy-related protein 11 [Macrobrachium rosenbergii]|uniref:putative autophagy-related protein 11 n=1 Tax=Macrobrachium rosenbergii TaxID=79674 RepID=UPI0034D77B80